MSPVVDNLIRKLVVLATLAGLGSAMAFLVVACGGASAQPPAAAAWHPLPTAPVEIDQDRTSVWTGKRLILFGRHSVTAIDSRGAPYIVKSFDAAEAYEPVSRTWTRLSPPAGPGYVPDYDAVWTGREMLAFGPSHSVAYNPATNSWRTLRKAVGGGLVVWTGREAIGWGGGCCGDAWGNGLAYDPATDTYRELAPSPLAPSQGPLGVWTGRELVLLSSGFDPAAGKPYPARLARAAAYDPARDTWRRLARAPRTGGAVTWNGREVLLVGAGPGGRAAFALDPAANRWRRLASAPLPVASAFWTGHGLLAWGGGESARALTYDPRADRWSVLPGWLPLRGAGEALAWTGSSLIVANGAHAAAFTPAP